MKKNQHGQYGIKYDDDVDGEEKGAWVGITPNAMLSRSGDYF